MFEILLRAGGYAGSNYLFLTLKERDIETGLDYFGARHYASADGRFTGVDPSGASLKPHNPQSRNRCAYCLNNPLKFVDTNGEWPTAIHDWIVDHALRGLSSSARDTIKKASKDVDFGSGIDTMSSDMIVVTATGHAHDPFVEGAPDLHYDVDVGLSYGKDGKLYASVYGTKSEFPGIEVFVQRPEGSDKSEQLIQGYNPQDQGRGIWYILGTDKIEGGKLLKQ